KLGLDKLDPFEIGKNFPISKKRHLRIKRRLIQSDPAYAGMVEKLDENIGRLLKAIDDLGLRDNTVVFFFSDNGGLSTAEGSPTSNKPLSEGKGWMYEGGIREPLIVRWPSVIEPGSTCSVPVTSTDFYPTILDIAGLPLMPEQHVDGVSLLPLLSRTGSIERKAIFWHYPHYGNQGGTPGASIRCGNYKLIEFFEDMHVELYNLSDDIEEKRELSRSMHDVAEQLRELLHEWQRDVNARIPERNPDWAYYSLPSFVRVTEVLRLNKKEGILYFKMQISDQNPTLYDVHLTEILEEFINKNVLLSTPSTRLKGRLIQDKEDKLYLKDLNIEKMIPIERLLTSLIEKKVLVRAYDLRDTAVNPGCELDSVIEIENVERSLI
ncbi:MAG: sulfatase/phosphatase domain-containing protein, partial [Promethearchaeota archaeon]